jgi:hypothetical protein
MALDNLDKITALARRTSYVERVQGAVVMAAVAVGNSVDTDPVRDQLRRSLAQRVLEAPEAYAPKFAWATATNLAVNPDVNQDSPSADHIAYAVSSVWDAFAGATPPPPAQG